MGGGDDRLCNLLASITMLKYACRQNWGSLAEGTRLPTAVGALQQHRWRKHGFATLLQSTLEI